MVGKVTGEERSQRDRSGDERSQRDRETRGRKEIGRWEERWVWERSEGRIGNGNGFWERRELSTVNFVLTFEPICKMGGRMGFSNIRRAFRVCLWGAVRKKISFPLSSSVALFFDGRWETQINVERGKLRIKMCRKSRSHGDFAAPNEMRKETDFPAPCRLDFSGIFPLHKQTRNLWGFPCICHCFEGLKVECRQQKYLRGRQFHSTGGQVTKLAATVLAPHPLNSFQ